MSINDPEYSPDPYAHAVRHLDAAEENAIYAANDATHQQATIDALLGIGWALLAVAKRLGERNDNH